MDYQINVYPSSEKEFLNIKVTNKIKQIKTIKENKPKDVYKNAFGAAITRYNDYVVNGQLIENYYEDIKASNIPELYVIDIIVRHDIANNAEIQTIQKSFTNFQKAFEKLPQFAFVASYWMVFDDFRELQLFFVPISDGYVTNLSVRNDLIDVIKKIYNVKDNILLPKAIQLFTKYINDFWAENADSQILSQEELERRARDYKEQDPMLLHAIAVGMLKENMNGLQKITNDNQQLVNLIENEKKRIEHDIQWCKETEQKIYQAEEDRIEAEKRRIEEEKRLEEERKLAEERRLEEERRQEEERKLEAQRLAEQAKRNIEMKALIAQAAGLEINDARTTINSQLFNMMVAKHKEWMQLYRIPLNIDFRVIPEHILNDDRRLSLKNADIEGVISEEIHTLVGASFVNCTFKNCDININLGSSEIINCNFIETDIAKSIFSSCRIEKIQFMQNDISGCRIENSIVKDSSITFSTINNLISAPGMIYQDVHFRGSVFKHCDMKNNMFTNCNLNEVKFNTCDVRNSNIQGCLYDGMVNEQSSFDGADIT